MPSHHKCAAHTLNLIAIKDTTDAEKDTSYKKLSRATFAKCKALWNKQSRSPLAADAIKDKCGVYFILPNATRWNSTFDALQGLVKIIFLYKGNNQQLCNFSKAPRKVTYLGRKYFYY